MTRRRAVSWSLAVALALACCLVWSSLPDLRSAPLLRVGLFASLALVGTALTLLRPPLVPLLGAAVLLRIALLPAAVSDDVHRYLWEGKLIRHGLSPYARPADDPALTPLRDAHWARMNHRDRRTAYPPLAQLAFAAAGAVSYGPLPLKLLFLASDLAILFLLTGLLRSRGLPLHRLGWLAFNPVALIGISAEAHYDTLFVLALVASWWAVEQKRPALAWIALAASVQLKIVSLVLAPLFWERGKRSCAWLFPATLVVLALPFYQNLPSLVTAVSDFAGSGQLNDAPYYLVTRLSGCPALAPGLFLVVAVAAWRQLRRGHCTFTGASLWTLGGLIVFSPVVHFWYLLWILPLLVLRPSASWLLLCAMQSGYFLAWHTEATRGWWGLPLPVMFAMWSPFALAGVIETVRGYLDSSRPDPVTPPPSAPLQ